MAFLSSIGGLLQQYSGANPDTSNAAQHFDQVAQNVPQSTLASGLAEAFRSNETQPFGQIASQLFSNGNPQQKASMLSTLASAVGPSVLAKFGSGSSPLAGILQSSQTAVTPEQATQVQPQEVQTLAEHAEKQDPSIVDKLSQLYAQHPTLIKTLGAAALAVAMSKMSQNHSL